VGTIERNNGGLTIGRFDHEYHHHAHRGRFDRLGGQYDVVGIVGALLAGVLLAPLFGISSITQGNFSLAGLLVSLLGAVVLLAIVNLFRRGAVR
jgi:ABC-type uncharacterized transport system permease subunit